jgi:hypothetical protein
MTSSTSCKEEATEDVQKFGGLEALDRPYLQTPFLPMIRKRAGWLVILFVGEMLTASAMTHYEKEIARAVVLALFVFHSSFPAEETADRKHPHWSFARWPWARSSFATGGELFAGSWVPGSFWGASLHRSDSCG